MTIFYPEMPNLPINERIDEIMGIIEKNQVTIIAGETGSGKSTQLPKICLKMGRGQKGLIGHTQPRRIAAYSIADRLKEELGQSYQHIVGVKTRFSDSTNQNTQIKLMTDGILLAEIKTDKLLKKYDTIIIDEAHERSINIDIILGYIKTILSNRPDLKLIITSATIDLEKFSIFFNQAPIVEVSGRTYPVEINYLENLTNETFQRDLNELDYISHAVTNAMSIGQGDILIFLSGEREIRITTQELSRLNLKNTEVLPLFGRMSQAEQHKIFHANSQKRRIILSTNVAETSITVPNIRFVIDPGFARISRYSYRTKIQRLPIEPIAQANANQRAGRCGRVSSGICYRLYTRSDFENRPRFTEPEILRTNLSTIILLLLDLNIKNIEAFDFLDAPDGRYIRDGIKLLQQLNAVSEDLDITPIGRQMAKLPIEPKLARIILGSTQYQCLTEVLIIASFLAIPDPRETPFESREKARQIHQKFAHPKSDFMSVLSLWEFFHKNKDILSTNKLRTFCRQHFLSYLRLCEWVDVHQQLFNMLSEMGNRLNQIPASYESIHQALMTGMLAHVGMKDKISKTYFGPRNIKFKIFPGSMIDKTKYHWVMCFTFLETKETYGLNVAEIDPVWIENIAEIQLKFNYISPHWETDRATVIALKTATLYGLPIYTNRKTEYGLIDPVVSREIFIREGLTAGTLVTSLDFYQYNQKKLAELANLEERSRRRDLLLEEEIIFDFYDNVIPENIYSTRLLESYYAKLEKSSQKEFYLSDHVFEDRANIAEKIELQYPKTLTIKAKQFPVSYVFDPASDADGVTILLDKESLPFLKQDDFSWPVPGLLIKKIEGLIKTLPKQFKALFNPIETVVSVVHDKLMPNKGKLLIELSKILSEYSDVRIHPSLLDEKKLPNHLRPRFGLEIEGEVYYSRDLDDLKQKLQSKQDNLFQEIISTSSFGYLASEILPEKYETWSMGEVKEEITKNRAGMKLKAYQALLDEGNVVRLAIFDDKLTADYVHQYGVARLIFLKAVEKINYAKKSLSEKQKLIFKKTADFGSFQTLMDHIAYSAIIALMINQQPVIRNETDFEIRLIKHQANLLLLIQKIMNVYFEIVDFYLEIKKLLDTKKNTDCKISIEDIKKQLDALFVPNFIALTPLNWLARYPVYLKTIIKRLNSFPLSKNKDETELKQLFPLLQAYYIMTKQMTEKKVILKQLDDFKWMCEEFRISLFAQELKTLYPISQKRLVNYWQQNIQSLIQQKGASLIELMIALFVLSFVTIGGFKLLLDLNHALPSATIELVNSISNNDVG
jgi:ATP-dependent helicase HrpA